MSRRAVSFTGRSKYGAQRTTVDGITFHSKRESQRYSELKLLEKAGLIRELKCQPRFALSVPSGANALTQIGEYVADFSFFDKKTRRFVVEDVKGMKALPLFKWKAKHLLAEYGITVTEVR